LWFYGDDSTLGMGDMAGKKLKNIKNGKSLAKHCIISFEKSLLFLNNF
jgi:hypothetical protein